MCQINARGGIGVVKPSNKSISAQRACCNQELLCKVGGPRRGKRIRSANIIWKRGLSLSFSRSNRNTNKFWQKEHQANRPLSEFLPWLCVPGHVWYTVNRSLDWTELCRAQSTRVQIGREEKAIKDRTPGPRRQRIRGCSISQPKLAYRVPQRRSARKIFSKPSAMPLFERTEP